MNKIYLHIKYKLLLLLKKTTAYAVSGGKGISTLVDWQKVQIRFINPICKIHYKK